MVGAGSISVSAGYLLPLNIASLIFTVADFFDCGIKSVVWLCNRAWFHHLLAASGRALSRWQTHTEKGRQAKADKAAAVYRARWARMCASFDRLRERTGRLSQNSPLANWLYLSSPLALAVLLLFAEPLSAALSPAMISASAILPLGFLFMNMFLDMHAHHVDEGFLDHAVSGICTLRRRAMPLDDAPDEQEQPAG